MNSDEDPSFPFICEGPSGVLAIFGESSGVLPVMSASAEVADLEEVFAKASMPIQSTQSDSQENTAIAKGSAGVLSEFPDAILVPPDKSKKADETNAPVLSDSVGLSEEIQEVLIKSTIVSGNAGLVPVVEATKTNTESSSTAVTGSVELAEEIMEAFANSKNVLDAESAVSNDPRTLQEELDRLEQLAVERVREIEGELVNSTKQITECSLSLDDSKEPKSTQGIGNKQKEFESEMVVTDATHTTAKEVGGSICDDVVETVDLTSPSELISVVPQMSSAIVDVERKQIKPSDFSLLESIVESTTALEKESENSEVKAINPLVAEEKLRLEGKSEDKIESPVVDTQGERSDAVSELGGKVNSSVSEVEAEVNVKDSELVGEKVNKLCDIQSKTNLSEKKDTKDSENDLTAAGEREVARCKGEKKELIGERVQCTISTDIKITREIIVEKQCLSDKSGASKDGPVKLANPNKSILETGKAAAARDEEGKQIKDIHNYETEDDDLEVLEAFIVKTATNPELAVCSVQPNKGDNVSKYSLESALLDDLTKTDNGSGASEVESRSSKSNEELSSAQSAGADSAHEKCSQKVTSSDTHSKACGNAVGDQSFIYSERKLVKKKSADVSSGDEIVSSDNAVKGGNKKAEKKVVFVEVKRRSGRPLISGKKALIGETSVLLRKECGIEQTMTGKVHSEKEVDGELAAKQDQSSIKRSERNSKKTMIDEESEPSMSGIVPAQQVVVHRGESKIQKKHGEQNTDRFASSKTNESKGEARPATIVKSVETSSKEKKKLKKLELNEDEQSISQANLETFSEKRSIENDSALKPCKKDERKLKENVETLTHRNISRQSNSSDAMNSRSTRSAKKTVPVKSTQLTNLSEHTKDKNKENVEKSTNVPVCDRDNKKITERSSPNESPLKNEIGRSQKRSRSLSEDGRNAKKKDDGNFQVSAEMKQGKGEQVEGLPNSQASTSTPKKAEDDSDRGSAERKASSIARSQKGVEEKNSHGSSSLVKRRRAEKEIKGSLRDAQLSPTSVKRKRGESGEKEISAETQIPPDVLKLKKAETDNAQSSPRFQFSPTALKPKRAEREFEQNMPNDGIKFTPVTHCDSNRTRAPNVYSESLFVEFEEITFDMLHSKAKQLVLPTPLWGAQVSSGKDLVAFSRLRADLSDDKPMVDKALVFQGSLKPIALINNEPVDLPMPCVRTFEDVVMLIRNFHSVSFCEGTGVKQRPQSKSCFRYLDVANPGARCSQCLEERRRVLFGCARKLRERINVMKAAKSHL